MGICYHCQDDVPDGQDFLVVGPDQSKYSVCAECMDDINTFFRSGKAERLNMSKHRPELFLTPNGRNGIMVCERDGEEVAELSNIVDISIDRKSRDPFYDLKFGINSGIHPYGNPYRGRDTESFILKATFLPLDKLAR